MKRQPNARPQSAFADLPALMTIAQAREFLQLGASAMNRRLADGRIYSIKLGDSSRAAVRIPRDQMLSDLGLVESATARRSKRKGDEEVRRVRVMMGLPRKSR